ENDPTASRRSLGNGRRSVRVSRDHRAPARELGAVLPVFLVGGRSRPADGDCRLANSSFRLGVKIELGARHQIETTVVVAVAPGKKSSRADAQIVETALHRGVNGRYRV